MVTSLLGETLVRSEGQELLDLVERIRAQAKGDSLEELPDVDLGTAAKLARAFTAYFHLANVTEQVHRGRSLIRERESEGGWLQRAVDKVLGADGGQELAEEVDSIAVRPVFTAHPTEVARRSTIDKLRQVAALLEQPGGPRRDRRLAEAVDLLWRTDEIRLEPPEPID